MFFFTKLNVASSSSDPAIPLLLVYPKGLTADLKETFVPPVQNSIIQLPKTGVG